MSENLEKVVLLTERGNNLNIFTITLSQYPWAKRPQVTDRLTLRAKKTLQIKSGFAEESKPIEITFLEGMYEVEKVITGSGQALMPEFLGKESLCKIDENLTGYRLILNKVASISQQKKATVARVLYAVT